MFIHIKKILSNLYNNEMTFRATPYPVYLQYVRVYKDEVRIKFFTEFIKEIRNNTPIIFKELEWSIYDFKALRFLNGDFSHSQVIITFPFLEGYEDESKQLIISRRQLYITDLHTLKQVPSDAITISKYNRVTKAMELIDGFYNVDVKATDIFTVDKKDIGNFKLSRNNLLYLNGKEFDLLEIEDKKGYYKLYTRLVKDLNES
jgi:hypothetical protein